MLLVDGGGIGVLSELTVLRELLHRIKSENSLLEVPYACDCFDIMAGSGIGAVLIILLGKLRLGIDATIEYYLRLEREVFTKKKLFSTGSVFSATALERVMGEIVARHCGRSDARMIEDEGQTVRCKVMVVARTADAIRAGLPTCIRSYRVPANQGPDCTIIEAVRATTAMPGMFKRATIYEQGVPIAYIGGALECNNPTDHLLSDLSAVFPDRGVASIVSIGSGQLHSTNIPESRIYDAFLPSKLIPAVRAIATDCEKTHQNLARRFEEAK
ncbi:FabD/lysophospholipase-like protein [Ceratobasidium sp. AG-I]|nr:FabD/lysophospholipase-like protein [Ceratobasidium sp. AG-I]